MNGALAQRDLRLKHSLHRPIRQPVNGNLFRKVGPNWLRHHFLPATHKAKTPTRSFDRIRLRSQELAKCIGLPRPYRQKSWTLK